jgi:transposase InsO family protein
MEIGRGYLMSVEQKDQIIRGVHQACSDGARQRLACDVVGINAKTLQRWVKSDSLADKRQTVVKRPTHKFSVYIHPKPLLFVATGPNQIFTWDITYGPTDVKGIFFYLYMVMAIFSRKIVGWQAHDKQSSALASDLIVDIWRQENIKRN